MQLQVEYFGQLRIAAGLERETVQLPDGSDAQCLVRTLVESRGDALREQLVNADGMVHPWILIAIDDCAGSPGSPLTDGQTVVLSSPISGG